MIHGALSKHVDIDNTINQNWTNGFWININTTDDDNISSQINTKFYYDIQYFVINIIQLGAPRVETPRLGGQVL